MRRPRILMLAWLMAPDRGSEWAAAWGMALAAARIADVVVLASPESAAAVTAWRRHHPDIPIEAMAVEASATWAKLLGRLVPRGFFFDYLAWLEAAGCAARRLHRDRPVDLAVHAALGCYWLPSPVVGLGVPSMWGPVAGATRTPPRLLPVLGPAGMLERSVERVAMAIASRLPPTRRTMRAATQVVVESAATLRCLPRALARRAPIIYRAALTQVPDVRARRRGRYILFPSTLSPAKGGTLAVEALRRVPPDVRLVFANSGDDEPRIRRRVARHGLQHRVDFLGAIPRSACFELVRGAAAVIFAGIHEDGGCALCETMLLGAPAVVLAHGGPKEIIERWGTDPMRVALVPPIGGPAATGAALGDALTRMLAHAPARDDPYLDQEAAIAELVRCYASILTGETNAVSGSALQLARYVPPEALAKP